MKNWMIVTNIHCKAVQNLAAAVQPWMADTIACETTLRPAYNGIFLSIDPVKPGFSIVVEEYDPATETQNIHITAQDPIHLLYAVSDFSNLYLPYARDAETSSGDGHYYFRQLFQEPLKPFQRQTAPRLKNRGLWTWGHVIYDYHRYIDNMVALKLNYLIIWNDFVPVNMQDVLDYAHENGVSVYLGFAWGWDTTMPDIRQWSAIADDVIRKYHAEYAAIPCDGIYFQTFTEHSDEVRDGIVVAEAAVHLVNKVSAALLAQKPTLQIQFGLHATSVLNRLDAFRQLDPRVSIIWEDVGAFPYHYMPHRTENFQQTRELNRHLQTLRDGGFGAVLKGVICLDWTCFRHQTGPFVLGCADRATATIPPQKKAILKLIQSYWLRNAHYAQALIQDFQEDAMVSCLVEDGYFEDCINLPTAIYAQLLWDSSQDMDELIQQAALRPDVTLF